MAQAIDRYYEASVTIRCFMSVVKEIKEKLDLYPAQLALFRSTIFGPWIDLTCYERDPNLVHALLLSEVVHDNATDHVVFYVGDREICFGREEFCLITGMRFGDIPAVKRGVGSTFRSRLFPNLGKITDLHTILKTPHLYNKLSTHDVVRVCLLLLVHRGFLGREKDSVLLEPLVELVNDLDVWNSFPWGSVFWNYTFHMIYHRVLSREEGHRGNIKARKIPSYSLTGFLYAFKIWIYEAFPETTITGFAKFRPNTIPRALGWRRRGSYKRDDIMSFICNATMPDRRPLPRLVPTPAELASDWYRDSVISLQSPWVYTELHMASILTGEHVGSSLPTRPTGFMPPTSHPLSIPITIRPAPIPMLPASRPPIITTLVSQMPPPPPPIICSSAAPIPNMPSSFRPAAASRGTKRPPPLMAVVSREEFDSTIRGVRLEFDSSIRGLSSRITRMEGHITRLSENRFQDDVPLEMPISSDIDARVDLASERVDVPPMRVKRPMQTVHDYTMTNKTAKLDVPTAPKPSSSDISRHEVHNDATTKKMANLDSVEKQPEYISEERRMLEAKIQMQDEVIAKQKAKIQMLEAAKLQQEKLMSLIIKSKIAELKVKIESGNPDHEVILSTGIDLRSVMDLIPESLRVKLGARFSSLYEGFKSLFLTHIDDSQWAKIESELEKEYKGFL